MGGHRARGTTDHFHNNPKVRLITLRSIEIRR